MTAFPRTRPLRGDHITVIRSVDTNICSRVDPSLPARIARYPLVMAVLTFAVPSPGQSAGTFLREERERAGLTQTQVAGRSGVARSNVAAIEAGRRTPSSDMTVRLLAAIRGEPWPQRARLHLTPPVLINIEMSRSAAFKVADDPEGSRTNMVEHMADLRRRNDGSSRRWLDFWDDVLETWPTARLVIFLLSTEPEDVARRKVSPITAVLSEEERLEAAARARKVWRATR